MNEGSLTQPSPGAVLLPSTLGIPARHGSPESRRRDPRLLWAPAISISGKTDQPLLTPQYRKRERRLVEKSEQIKLDPKVRTDADLSHLTRVGNHRTQLPISFLPHRINPSKIPPSVRHRGPGPASYQPAEALLYPQQPRVRIRPLIGAKVKRERRSSPEKETVANEKFMKNSRPFWTTIGTRTYNSRLPNAPISTIHHRFRLAMDKENNKNGLRSFSTPGPAAYPWGHDRTSLLGVAGCSARGTTIAPRYREKRTMTSGPGPAMIERASIDRGYKSLLRTAPTFSMSSRWSPYSHTYTAEGSDDDLC